MNRLKQLRTEKNINQYALAKLLCLEVAGISKLETGRVPLKDTYIIKLAEYFDVSTDYLLGTSDIRNPNKIEQNQYLKEADGLTNEEIIDALKFYKTVKKRVEEKQDIK